MRSPRTNINKLVMISVQGYVAHPEHRGMHMFDADGKPFMLASSGGITYNVHIGDSAFGWEADHLEPSVSAIADHKDRNGGINSAFNYYSCTGNEATIITGDAKGKKGVVIGHHGGGERVIIEFPEKVMEKMTLDDRILIKGFGQGLKFLDYPDIVATNLDPRILPKWGVIDNGDGIEVPVAAEVPGYLMGSGIGSIDMGKSDYDIMTADKNTIKKLGLDKLRFGDFVAIVDHDNRFGRSWRKGAVTIGIVIHSDCYFAGHGPGVTTLLSTVVPGKIKYRISPDANIGKALAIGRFAREKTR